MLETVSLENNNFNFIPDRCFQGLTNLKNLSMAYNFNLTPWVIPADLAQSSKLVKLDLRSTNIIGTLPDVFDSLILWLNNQRHEFNDYDIKTYWPNIPKHESGGLLGNIEVWLQGNFFTGLIPNLSNCTSLFDLNLNENLLTGMLPSSLKSLSSLRKVSLNHNFLEGPYPSFRMSVKVDFKDNVFCNLIPGPCDPRVTVLIDIDKHLGYPISWQVHGSEKIITVNFARMNLKGTISPAFANLTHLKNLDLSDNDLEGSIPEGLTNLAQLEILYVSSNNLSGYVPKFSTKVILRIKENPNIKGGGGGTALSSDAASSGFAFALSSAWIIGIVGIVVFFVGVIVFVFCKCQGKIRHRKSGRVNNPENGEGGVNIEMTSVLNELHNHDNEQSDIHVFEDRNTTISIGVLQQATDNFNKKNILGKGGFGVVYKGELHDGRKIAVKKMNSVAVGSKGLNDFQAEIAVLSQVRHRHLVTLLGHCINDNERFLVYEYMFQGTLTQHLFDWRENGCAPLTWKQRIAIALDIARGVEYLHSLAHQSFIHRDLKPPNILLGDDLIAKVADFGLVKKASDGTFVSKLAGTLGYIAPEYAVTGEVTTKVDVYAFGVILMELITGRKVLDNTVSDERSHLVSWFRRVLINKESISKTVDQTLDPDEETMKNIYQVAELAGHCTARESYQRPDMGHVVNVLVPLVEEWKPKSHEEENFDIDIHTVNLSQHLRRWKADEGTSTMFELSIS
ncbi:hypothetical protein V8G54_018264 [Vigna mungo]|uniref:Protein kinase domain-containing protein n=1 Tax=Vigna mungo TaxID=3915 RepID=A0AAQ3NA88_VIGMU